MIKTIEPIHTHTLYVCVSLSPDSLTALQCIRIYLSMSICFWLLTLIEWYFSIFYFLFIFLFFLCSPSSVELWMLFACACARSPAWINNRCCLSSFIVDVTMQIGRCAVTIRSGYTVWHVMKWQKSYVKLMLIQRQHHSSGHSTIRPKQLICHKMDLRNIPEHHHDCLIHQSRFVICL